MPPTERGKARSRDPDAILNLAAGAVSQAIRKLGLAVAAAAPMSDGTLRLSLRNEASPLRPGKAGERGEAVAILDWGRFDGGAAVPRLGGRVRCTSRAAAPHVCTVVDCSAVENAAARTLGELSDPAFGMLAFVDDATDVVFDSSVSQRLFGPHVAQGRTRWRGALCASMQQAPNPPSLTLTFDGPDGATVVSVLPVDGKISVRREAAPGRGTRNGATAGLSVDVYIAFLAARRIPPASRVVLPEPVAFSGAGEIGEGRGAGSRSGAFSGAGDFGEGRGAGIRSGVDLAPNGSGRAVGNRGPRDDSLRRPHVYGSEKGWGRFYHPMDIVELTEVRWAIYGPHSEVVLGERECHTAHPASHGPRIGAFEFSALEPWPATYRRHHVMSMLSERDIALGAGDLCRRMLSAAEKEAGGCEGCASKRLVALADTCASALLAEDVDLLARQVSSGHVVATESGENLYARNRRFFQMLMDSSGAADSPPVGVVEGTPDGGGRYPTAPSLPLGSAEGTPSRAREGTGLGRVNLVGFVPCRARGEIVQELTARGVGVTCFLPDIRLDRVAGLKAACANVFYPSLRRKEVYEAVSDFTGLERVEAGSPYGVQGTRSWLEAIIDHRPSTIDHRPSAIPADADCEAERKLAELRPLCSAVRILFVLSEEDEREIRTPEGAFGVPMFAMLEEAGFACETMRVGADVRSPEELRERLSASDARLVYSDVTCDWRVLDCGKRTFSTKDFEMGFPGAVRTAERLLRRAGNRFFDALADRVKTGGDA